MPATLFPYKRPPPTYEKKMKDCEEPTNSRGYWFMAVMSTSSIIIY